MAGRPKPKTARFGVVGPCPRLAFGAEVRAASPRAMPPDELQVTQGEAAEIASWAATLPSWGTGDADLPLVLVIEPLDQPTDVP